MSEDADHHLPPPHDPDHDAHDGSHGARHVPEPGSPEHPSVQHEGEHPAAGEPAHPGAAERHAAAAGATDGEAGHASLAALLDAHLGPPGPHHVRPLSAVPGHDLFAAEPERHDGPAHAPPEPGPPRTGASWALDPLGSHELGADPGDPRAVAAVPADWLSGTLDGDPVLESLHGGEEDAMDGARRLWEAFMPDPPPATGRGADGAAELLRRLADHVEEPMARRVIELALRDLQPEG